MNRRGINLTELACTLTVTMMLLQTGGVLLHEVLGSDHARKDAPVELVDMACDRLRQDAIPGAQVSGAMLVAGTHHWLVSDGMLCRDGRPLIHVLTATWSSTDGHVEVRLSPLHLPKRVLELWP